MFTQYFPLLSCFVLYENELIIDFLNCILNCISYCDWWHFPLTFNVDQLITISHSGMPCVCFTLCNIQYDACLVLSRQSAESYKAGRVQNTGKNKITSHPALAITLPERSIMSLETRHIWLCMMPTLTLFPPLSTASSRPKSTDGITTHSSWVNVSALTEKDKEQREEVTISQFKIEVKHSLSSDITKCTDSTLGLCEQAFSTERHLHDVQIKLWICFLVGQTSKSVSHDLSFMIIQRY